MHSKYISKKDRDWLLFLFLCLNKKDKIPGSSDPSAQSQNSSLTAAKGIAFESEMQLKVPDFIAAL